jgi:thioredoxin 1
LGEKHKSFISDGDEELERIKEKKLKQLLAKIRQKEIEMPNKPVHVTDSNFNKMITKNSLALIDFWASWCGPCLALAPIIDELAEEYAGKVFVGKLNVDENPRTAKLFQVFSIPTLVVMKNGREVDRIVGVVPKKYIEATLKKHME